MDGSTSTQTILVGEDELEVLGYLDIALKCGGYAVETAQDGDEVLSCLRSSRSDIAAVLLDIGMPNRDGLDTVREIRKFDSMIPVIMISGLASPQNIVAAMKNGATDFLCKPVPHDDLQRTVRKAVETRISPGGPSLRLPAAGGSFASRSQRMREIQNVVAQIGWSEVPVLIQGETGTGKEVLARELHARSARVDKPFLKLNCAALPAELVESELFGYERGAFTGAVQKKAGMFELADGGTILLDEIGDMDFRLQAKLLQVLQDHEFRRIGGRETIKVNVRVMAATHRDLEKAMSDNTFREDLYYRLSVVTLHVPPLRDRTEDIIPLAEFLLQKHAVEGVPMPRLTEDLRRAFVEYHWPGNVRELENWVRKLTVIRDSEGIARELDGKIRPKEVAPKPLVQEFDESAQGQDGMPVLEQVTKAKQQAERTAILAALESTAWNRKEAAVLLKVDYKALLYRMKRLGIHEELSETPTTSRFSNSSPVTKSATATNR